jgi:ATP-dependent helicase YprA (DUF1998 family)/very-short-patch-repair endonuclease
MDAFRLHRRVIEDYHDYATSFIHIKDEDIDRFVRAELAQGALWPEPLLQLNPAYEQAGTVLDLVREGLLHPGCGDLFRDRNGDSFRLFAHQEQAIRTAKRHEPYVLTTGTGSGKSLTYLIPIVDHVLRHNPQRRSVRAIIVYPMNALINSQLEAIRRMVNALPNGFPVHFERYTGQESDQQKDRIRENPPHVLLTNYVMLELMMTRMRERVFVDRTLAELEFLALDELHTYTGRQGADVAMLVRRLRQRCGNPHLLCIGTSATMVAGEGDRAEQRRTVAGVAETLFGVPVSPDNVIDETLRRATVSEGALSVSALREAVRDGLPPDVSYTAFVRHPLAIWVEEIFGVVADETGHLRRRKPIPLAQGAQWLAEGTDLPLADCQTALEQILRVGNQVRSPAGEPVFAFKLHQFISQGGAVYATLEPPGARHLTLQGRHYASKERVLAPLVFCRVCGQEYYQVRWDRDNRRFLPLIPGVVDDEDQADVSTGYLVIESAERPVWSQEREEELPDNWFNVGKNGRTSVKRDYQAFLPQRVYVQPDGQTASPQADGSAPEGASPAWFIPAPFLTCLTCGVVYTRKEREFRKLAQLSNEGRSTATTLLGIATVADLRQQADVPREAAKLLSFTDNRQDASLQAGHFNDFGQVALLRAAIYRALETHQVLDHTTVAQRVFEALDLPQEAYARTASEVPRTRQINQEALTRYIEYRIYEDLRRGWRVVQPNLEQAGLMRIGYEDLGAVCADESLWQKHPVPQQAAPEVRERVCRVFLDHLRRELAISADCLQSDEQQRLMRAVNQALKYPWRFGDEDENEEELRTAAWFVLPRGPEKQSRFTFSLAPATALGRFLRATETWPFLRERISTIDYERFVEAFVAALVDASYLARDDKGEAVQVRADCLLWQMGDGTAPDPDPVRSRWMRDAASRLEGGEANRFFRRLYQETAAQLKGLEGREHTAQVMQHKREQREDRFRVGDLACLFCSPTMELGVDISDLNAVHMRNVPPTPANYAQRSGRAGRSNQPALVVTNCAKGSAHDQYFFQRPGHMVAGSVVPPRMDLGNQELVEAHVHALWLAKVGLSFQRSITEIVETTEPGLPLRSQVQLAIQLSDAALVDVFAQSKRVLETGQDHLRRARWFSEEWLWRTVQGSARAFDKAFNRWREMYTAAERQLHAAREEVEGARRTGNRRDKALAERRDTEANRQKDLLCNFQGGGDSDFYPYRYLASEGFLPGYNFPRLPIRAYIAVGDDGDFISRPRFLAVREFAPMNIVYHEGRKYRVVRSQSASGDLSERFVRAKLCGVCGYFHEGEQSTVDLCQNCGTFLNADTGLITNNLFEMTDVLTRPVERITCDEEERLREGYHIASYFRFSPGQDGTDRTEATANAADGTPLLHLTYGPSATLWQVNTGWKDSPWEGFSLQVSSGEWQKGHRDEMDPSDLRSLDTRDTIRHGIQLLVRDTRNILLIRPTQALPKNEAFLASLQSALQQGIRAAFQVGERELGAERIGEGARRAILVWEDAEGGLGVLDNLLSQNDGFARVAQAGLAACHFDADGNDLRPAEDDVSGCAVACYDCLMSYTNQWDHPILDRHLIWDALIELSSAITQMQRADRSYDEQYIWLRERLDSLSDLERRFLDYLYQTGRRLPDSAQQAIPDHYVQADFHYGESGVCVFCDGSVHDQPEVQEKDRRLRSVLEHTGYTVIVIRYDRDLEAQISHYEDIFGPAHV